MDQCLENAITPIVCVDRSEVLAQADLIDSSNYKKIIVAYEPVEHIGTGVAQNPNEVSEAIKEVRAAFGDASIIYGGSVNGGNIDPFLNMNEIKGFLIGTTSLDPVHFSDIIQR